MEKEANIIDRIIENNVRQKPKWHFQFLRYSIWSCYVVCILVGALSFSIILFAGLHSDFLFWKHLGHSRLELLLGLLPLFWMGLLIIALLLSTFILKKAPRGFRYHRRSLLVLSTLISITLGSIFYYSGGALHLERAFAEKVSSYESIESQKRKTWSQPEKGFLSGKILEIKEDTLLIMDFSNTNWHVIYRNASISERVVLNTHQKIKIVGISEGKTQFQAKEIWPWEGFYSNLVKE